MMSLSWSGKQQHLLCGDLRVGMKLGYGHGAGHLGNTQDKGKVREKV